jgi:hypothetical protein
MYEPVVTLLPDMYWPKTNESPDSIAVTVNVVVEIEPVKTDSELLLFVPIYPWAVPKNKSSLNCGILSAP